MRRAAAGMKPGSHGAAHLPPLKRAMLATKPNTRLHSNAIIPDQGVDRGANTGWASASSTKHACDPADTNDRAADHRKVSSE